MNRDLYCAYYLIHLHEKQCDKLNTDNDMTILKLMRLLYIAQIVSKGKLLKGDFIKNEFGPSLVSIKDYLKTLHAVKHIDYSIIKIDEARKRFLQNIYSIFGIFKPYELEDILTSQDGVYKSSKIGELIPKNKIVNDYNTLIKGLKDMRLLNIVLVSNSLTKMKLVYEEDKKVL